MAQQLSDLELQNLRHLIHGCDVTATKLSAYAAEATDTKVKNFFEKGAEGAKQNREQLVSFLG